MRGPRAVPGELSRLRARWPSRALAGRLLGLGTALLLLLPAPSALGQAARASARSLALPEGSRDHWIGIADLLLRRVALVDGDSGRYLGTLSGTVGAIVPHFSHERKEIYLAGTWYSRGVRGDRSDAVVIYDADSLSPVAEIEIPPRRADYVGWAGTSTLSDDGRFLVVFNMLPGTSLSIVDVESRRFIGEIPTPGCFLAYPAGPRRVAMLCGDGSLMLVGLDESGREASRSKSAPFFDPTSDPITEKAVRIGDRWLFASFDGWLHEVDVSGAEPRFRAPWSLLDDADRASEWRIGGTQHLAVHRASGRLYSLVHQGGEHAHKEPGSEVWVYDLETRRRVQRIEVPNLASAAAARVMELGDGFGRFLLDRLVPGSGADLVQVTQDADPLLFLASRDLPVVAVLDARTGALRREIHRANFAANRLMSP